MPFSARAPDHAPSLPNMPGVTWAPKTPRQALERRCFAGPRSNVASSMCADEAALSRLDSSIKKNSAFIKRMRTALGEAAAQKQLLEDIARLNLSKVGAPLNAVLAWRGEGGTHW